MAYEEDEEMVDRSQPRQLMTDDPQGSTEADRYIHNPGQTGPGDSLEEAAPGLDMDELLGIIDGSNLGGDGGSGGSGGGGGGGGGSNSLANALADVYMELWHMNPPPGVIEEAVAAGLNPIQFREQIMADPAWRKSPVYKQMKQDRMIELMQLLGARPS